jgi:hypothetical protein
MMQVEDEALDVFSFHRQAIGKGIHSPFKVAVCIILLHQKEGREAVTSTRLQKGQRLDSS